MSVCFENLGSERQGIPPSLPASSSTFGVEMGVTPSATMLPAHVQQQLSIPFVSARARIAEFERLREELRKTEIVRERQVERLHALAGEASAPQVRMTLWLFTVSGV